MHVEEMKSKNGDLCKTNFNRTLGGGGRGMEYGHLIFSYIVVIMDFMVEEIGALKENYQTI
jgi:hypothetical protein